MFSTILLLYILFFTELQEATNSGKDGSSNSSIWLSWVETSGYEVCDTFHCWRRLFHLITYCNISALSSAEASPFVLEVHFARWVQAQSGIITHSADPFHPWKSLWASTSPVSSVRRRGCHASLLRLLSHPSRYSQYLVLLIGKDTLPAVSRRSWLFSCRLY